MNKPNFDTMTPAEVREWGSEAAYRASQLGEVKATLIVNCKRGTLGCDYDDKQTVVYNLVAILGSLLKKNEQLDRQILDSGERETRCMREIGDEIDGYKSKIETLQAIVAKVPTDAEGVPCFPGDQRWAWTHRGDEAVVLRGVVFWQPGMRGRQIDFGLRAHPVPVGLGYSTEAAARARKENTS